MIKIDKVVYFKDGKHTRVPDEEDIMVLFKNPEIMYDYIQCTSKSVLAKMFTNIFLDGQHYSNENDVNFIENRIKEWLDKPCCYWEKDLRLGCDPDFKRDN